MCGADAPAGSIGVVICAYSEARWEQLRAAVASVQGQSLAPAETVVVIDHNERLRERARTELTSPSTRVIASTGRPGLSGARNTGLRALESDLVAFLDDDARATEPWLEQLTAPFAHASVLATGGVAKPDWEAAPARWLSPELYWVIGCSYRGLPEDVAEIRNPIGANMAFRREALLTVGGFTEGVGRVEDRPLGDEETEVSVRVRMRWPDAQILHVPAALVTHTVPMRRASWSYLASRCWAEGRSKAHLTGAVGAASALASERRYVARVLPAGVIRGLLDGIRGDLAGLARAASIVVALALTSAGYGYGRVTARLNGNRRETPRRARTRS